MADQTACLNISSLICSLTSIIVSRCAVFHNRRNKCINSTVGICNKRGLVADTTVLCLCSTELTIDNIKESVGAELILSQSYFYETAYGYELLLVISIAASTQLPHGAPERVCASMYITVCKGVAAHNDFPGLLPLLIPGS